MKDKLKFYLRNGYDADEIREMVKSKYPNLSERGVEAAAEDIYMTFHQLRFDIEIGDDGVISSVQWVK